MNKINKKISSIAKEVLDIPTLKARNSDSLDFHELSVWQIKRALRLAFLKGSETEAERIKNHIRDLLLEG